MAATTQASKRRFYERYIESAQHSGNHVWDFANKLTHGYVSYFAQAIKNKPNFSYLLVAGKFAYSWQAKGSSIGEGKSAESFFAYWLSRGQLSKKRGQA